MPRNAFPSRISIRPLLCNRTPLSRRRLSSRVTPSRCELMRSTMAWWVGAGSMIAPGKSFTNNPDMRSNSMCRRESVGSVLNSNTRSIKMRALPTISSNRPMAIVGSASMTERRSRDVRRPTWQSVNATTDGLVHTHFTKRLDAARDSYQRAVDANPNFSLAWLLKGTMHAFMDEGAIALADTTRAGELSPLDSHKYYYDSLTATACLAAGEDERALAMSEASSRANRRHTSTLRVKIAAQWRLGQAEEAHKTAVELMALEPGLTVSCWLSRSPTAPFSLGREFAETLRQVGVPD